MPEQIRFSVGEFVDYVNQTLEYAYPIVEIEGEVASFKLNQGKFIFFDIKDEQASVGCFMMAFQLRVPLEDGMKVIVSGSPKLTKWGKFSLTVRSVRPSGEGAIKKSFELLKKKLELEGLFAPERKRALPALPQRIGVISSTQAAGYGDFIKILDDRWGGLRVDVAHVQVQGADAPDQMIRALEYFNSQEELPEVIVLLRGGGSADDLLAFSDERLVRAIAASRVPTLVGVGHEQDETLADYAADVRAATPSNAAQLLVPDRREIIQALRASVRGIVPHVAHVLDEQARRVRELLAGSLVAVHDRIATHEQQLARERGLLAAYDPSAVLQRGYAIVRGEQRIGQVITVETKAAILKARVESYDEK